MRATLLNSLARFYSYATLIDCHEDGDTLPISAKLGIQLIASVCPYGHWADSVADNRTGVDHEMVRYHHEGWEIILWFSEEMGTRELAAQWGDAASHLAKTSV